MINTKNLISGEYTAAGNSSFQATNPSTQKSISLDFISATEDEVNLAVLAAKNAARPMRNSLGSTRAKFLRSIAENIVNLGDELVFKAMEESGLPEGRIRGERGRTCNQLKLFAELLEEGHWVNAIIDEALPDRKPARSDLRLMKRSVGPVVVFTASNFPLAFSTAGGDTASAFAAGCPVIVKAHPAHPGTNALVSSAINEAIKEHNLPSGAYSTVYDEGHSVGTQLVLHPDVKSVAFTGSHKGGLALHKLAQSREEPIPVFAEMGSINPVFILDEILSADPAKMAKKIAFSANMGAGQFCTNPGIQVINEKHADVYVKEAEKAFSELDSYTMLTEGIYENYKAKRNACLVENKVEEQYKGIFSDAWKAAPATATVSAEEFIKNPKLHTEVFGPFSLIVICPSENTMEDVADALEGQLTATIMGTEAEIIANKTLSNTLEEKVGRLVYNGVPTGVEVSHAMQHGGPFPASTDNRFTSVGSESIYRFVRPVCFQDCPDALLPLELQHDNPLGILRKVNGKVQ